MRNALKSRFPASLPLPKGPAPTSQPLLSKEDLLETFRFNAEDLTQEPRRYLQHAEIYNCLKNELHKQLIGAIGNFLRAKDKEMAEKISLTGNLLEEEAYLHISCQEERPSVKARQEIYDTVLPILQRLAARSDGGVIIRMAAGREILHVGYTIDGLQSALIALCREDPNAPRASLHQAYYAGHLLERMERPVLAHKLN
jgi:hypothetical protein